jgi:choline dehydrogenase-like flavoprotein
VVAPRLAENPDVSVLLVEAGGHDDVPSVTEAHRWFENLATERDWQFVASLIPISTGLACRYDGSIMPRVTTGNTMAACVVIGESAGELLRTAHKFSGVEACSDQGAALR